MDLLTSHRQVYFLRRITEVYFTRRSRNIKVKGHKQINILKEKTMSANEKLKPEVRIKGEFVEVKFASGHSMFIFAIDKDGLLHFPEQVKGSLPSYVVELAHELWCGEFGISNCVYPTEDIRLWMANGNGKLACDSCGSDESSTEKIGWPRYYWQAYEGLWTNDGERLYWVAAPDPGGWAILCSLCLRDLFKVEFPVLRILSS